MFNTTSNASNAFGTAFSANASNASSAASFGNFGAFSSNLLSGIPSMASAYYNNASLSAFSLYNPLIPVAALGMLGIGSYKMYKYFTTKKPGEEKARIVAECVEKVEKGRQKNILHDGKEKLEAVFGDIYDRYHGDKPTLWDKLCRAIVYMIQLPEVIWDRIFNSKGKSFVEIQNEKYTAYIKRKCKHKQEEKAIALT